MSDYSDQRDATYYVERPVPAGWTDEWDTTIWNAGKVYRWSPVYEAWLDCEFWVSVAPFESLNDAYERRTEEPFWLDYAIFFPCEE